MANNFQGGTNYLRDRVESGRWKYDVTSSKMKSLPGLFLSQAEGLSRVAAFAVVEVDFAEAALAVVTGGAALRARLGEVLRGEGRGDLPALREAARADRVALLAVEVLARAVVCVAEAYAEGAARGRRPRVAAVVVTCTARGDVVAARLAAGRVTLVTGLVRAQGSGNGPGDAAARRRVTGGAATLRARVSRVVLRVVELRVEACEPRKLFERRVLLIERAGLVADGAQGTVGSRELRLVATDAVLVLGKGGLD